MKLLFKDILLLGKLNEDEKIENVMFPKKYFLASKLHKKILYLTSCSLVGDIRVQISLELL